MNHKFNDVYIDKSVYNNKYTKRIIDRLKCDYHIVGSIKDIEGFQRNDVFDARNKILYIGMLKGDIIKKCPGSDGHICCNYYVMNLYGGCPLGCTYCILQSYMNQTATIINTNLDEIFDYMHSLSHDYKDRFYRIGTGEMADSLYFDDLTDFSLDFIDFFNEHKNLIFEFKTKTVKIDNLLKRKVNGNIVAGFSLNADYITEIEEGDAESNEDKIRAAVRLINNGYKIAFHFDPIFNIPNFDTEYKRTIDLIFENIPPEHIVWLSLGTFRYTSELKSRIQDNYQNSKILYDEFIYNKDNKYRYFYPLRKKMYNTVIKYLKSHYENLPIYLCMESHEMWEDTLGFMPNGDNMNLLFKKMVVK